MESIGQQLRILRLSKYLTIKQLSELSGVSGPTIQKIESGKNVNLYKLESVCQVFNKTINIEVV